MIRLLLWLLCAMVSTSLVQTSNTPNCSGNNNTDMNCQKVKTFVARPPSQLFKDQPLYHFVLGNFPTYNRLDNVCLTLFPLPGSTEFYKVFVSRVYIDNSHEIVTFLVKSYAAGANQWTTPQIGHVNYNLGYIGCGAYLRYSCILYGATVPPAFLSFGPGLGPVGNGTGKLTEECIQNAQSLAEENGLDLGDFYVLPYNLPTRCVFQQICLPEDSPLYCQQNNTCKA